MELLVDTVFSEGVSVTDGMKMRSTPFPARSLRWPVDQLCREADRIGGNRGKSRFVEHMAAQGGHTDGKAERTENVDQNGMFSQKERTRGIPITRFLEVMCSGTG